MSIRENIIKYRLSSLELVANWCNSLYQNVDTDFMCSKENNFNEVRYIIENNKCDENRNNELNQSLIIRKKYETYGYISLCKLAEWNKLIPKVNNDTFICKKEYINKELFEK